MKNEKQVKQPAEKKQPNNAKDSRSTVSPAVTDTGAATANKRAGAGRGLANEGTVASYEDQNRND